MKTVFKYRAYFGLLIILSSCGEVNESYKYLNQVFDIQQENTDNFFYLIDINGCGTCIEKNLNFLTKHRLNMRLIIVGEIRNDNWKNQIKNLEKYFTILYDKERVAIRYGLNLSKPLLLLINKDDVIHEVNIDEQNLTKLYSILEEN